MPLLPAQLNKDYYDLLGVSKDASAAEVRKAFHNKSKEGEYRHPDKGGIKEKNQELVEAYSVISDADNRKEYDASSPFGAQPSAPAPASSQSAGQGGFSATSEDTEFDDVPAHDAYHSEEDAEEDDFENDFGDDASHEQHSQNRSGLFAQFAFQAELLRFYIRLQQEIYWAALAAELQQAQNNANAFQPPEEENKKGTGFELSHDCSVEKLSEELSNWVATGKERPGFSCVITQEGGKVTLEVTATRKDASEMMSFLESKGLVKPVGLQSSYGFDSELDNEDNATPSFRR